jgi:hypothetical protein
MYHKLYRVTDFALLGNYNIEVHFDDGSKQVIDFKPVLYGEILGPLRDPAVFNQVTIDPVAHTLSWPNGADFDPETLRNWPDYKEELAAKAFSWLHVAAS